MEERMKKVGQRIKELRSRRGIAQTDLAKMIELSQTNLSNIERGRTGVTLQNLFKIQEVLGCSMVDFFTDADSTPTSVKQQAGSSVSIDDAIKVLQMIKEIGSSENRR